MTGPRLVSSEFVRREQARTKKRQQIELVVVGVVFGIVSASAIGAVVFGVWSAWR